jgi:hypothetical protein
MYVLDETGHTEVRWDTKDELSVEAARKEFDALVKQGFSPLVKESKTDEEMFRVREFPPEVDEILWLRPLVGG